MSASLMVMALQPDQEGYSVDWGQSAVATKLAGGASKLRRDYIFSPARVSVTWTCTPTEMEYLKTFYRVTGEGTTPFEMDLLVGQPTLTRHVCRFVPKTFKTAAVRGKELFKVQAQIEAELLAYDDAFDEGLVTSFEAFGSDASPAYALLAKIVNVTMPANIK